MQDEPYKRCRVCGETKPVSEFHVKRANKDGLQGDCKLCKSAYDAATRERRLERRRARYAANRNTENARTRAWKQANPGHYVKSRLATRRPGIGYDPGHRYADIPDASVAYGLILLHDPCSYCGGSAGELDHIVPLAEGGTNDWWNLTSACRSCNRRKNDRSVIDMLMRLVILRLYDNWAPRLGEDQRLMRRMAA